MEYTREQHQLHFSVWQTVSHIRQNVDIWSFKSYVLGAIFYRYISEKLADCVNRMMADVGYGRFSYSSISDVEAEGVRNSIVAEMGFFMLPSQLFYNVCRFHRDDETLNIRLSKIFRYIESSAQGTSAEHAIEGIFSDFMVDNILIGRDSKERSKVLAKILKEVNSMDLTLPGKQEIEPGAWGDAYEYFIRMYSSIAGRRGGEAFTPQEVSEVLARIASHDNPSVRRVYDPACGSGSMLLTFKSVVGEGNARDLMFYGQEISATNYNICRSNMFMHDVCYDNFDIQLGDTLVEPKHMSKDKFDAIISNPPFSQLWSGNYSSELRHDVRFTPCLDLAPRKASDLAFVMHILYHLSVNGTAAIVVFPGVLYRGGSEYVIRKYLVENNFVDTVIQLPKRLFFGTDVAPCVLVLRKAKRPDNDISFVDASQYYVKGDRQNLLCQNDQDKIVELYQKRVTNKHICRLVTRDEVEANEYNLSVSSYVWPDNSCRIDINAVNEELAHCWGTGNKLRCQIDSYIDLDKRIISDSDEMSISEKWFDFKDEEVEWRRLSECCEINGCLGFTGRTIKYDGLGAHRAILLGPGNIQDGVMNYDNCRFISWEQKCDAPMVSVCDNNIIFCKTGATIGKVALVKDLPEEATVNPQIVVLQYINIHPKYLYYIIASEGFQRKVKALSGMGTIPSISQWNLSKILVPVVPRDRQIEIIRKLDKFSAFLANIRKEQALIAQQYEYYKKQLSLFYDSCNL